MSKSSFGEGNKKNTASSLSLATWGKDIYREYIEPIEEIIEKYRKDELQEDGISDISEKKCSVIDDLPETCSICWDVLNDETYKIGEICAHPLCVYCWVDYTNRGSNSCPVCRQQLVKKRGRGRPRKNR